MKHELLAILIGFYLYTLECGEKPPFEIEDLNGMTTDELEALAIKLLEAEDDDEELEEALENDVTMALSILNLKLDKILHLIKSQDLSKMAKSLGV